MGRANGNLTAVAAPRRAPISRAQREGLTKCQLTVTYIKWPRNGEWDEKGYAICSVTHAETGEALTAKGRFGPVSVGEIIEVERAEFKEDSRYGAFLQIWKRGYKDPVTREALIGYLENLPGVGETMATAIVDSLGNDALAKIDADPQLILTVKTKTGRHLRPEDLQKIMGTWEELRRDRRNMLFLSSMGLGDSDAKAVSAHFGDATIDTLKRDPYQMTRVSGIGFKTADLVAQHLGINSTDPRRLAAGMEYLLERAENSGHVCLTEAEMLKRAPKLLDRGFQKPTEQQLRDAIQSMVDDGRLWREPGPDGVERIYTTELYVVETRLYNQLHEMLHEDEDNPPESIPNYAFMAPDTSILTDEQWGAVVHARHDKLSILSGGPGCGKTTTLKELLDDADRRGETYTCLAPTGKAAKRMKESTGRDAMTVHRKLGRIGRFAPHTMDPKEGFDPLAVIKDDIVIVDEASMLDMRLAERLFSHLDPKTRVVLVGDPDQLPAVGAGSVLLDLIESGRVPRTHLTQVFRQGKGSLLVENAYRIRQGQVPFWTKEEAEQATGRQYLDDFKFIECDDEDKAVALTMSEAERVAAELHVKPDEIMVTAPSKAGGAGTWALARAIQAKRNPAGEQFRDGEQPLRVGDLVMNTKNRYGTTDSNTGETEPDIMNGDVGRVTEWDEDRKMAIVEFDEGELTYLRGPEMDTLISAYSSTVHKVQGSEAPGIISPVVSDSIMMTRNLLYTNLTRGKKKAVLIGSKDVIAKAVERNGSDRNTTLDLKVGAIPKILQRRYEAVKINVKSAQALLGNYNIKRVGHIDLTPQGKREMEAERAASAA